MKKINKKFVISFLILFLFVQFYSLTEYAFAVTDQVVVTLDVDSGITISDGAAVTMAPHIGVSANGSIGSSSWLVITNGAAGYSLAVKASASPALVSGGNSFADYTETAGGTPELWSVGSGAKEFGYSAYGTDTATGTWGTSASCGAAGVPAAAQKYVGFSTSDKIIATRATTTPVAGITTTICFAAQQNAVFAAAGTYTATITGTAVTL
ncbi:MAG: hypothetical protein WC609_03075 [Candidatus Paceibacterota bacterium]|jgi:hypothetical protein